MQQQDCNNQLYHAADKILTNIYKKIQMLNNLTRFEIIPNVQNDLNRSPVHYSSDGCLALESWCVKHLYQYAYRHLLKGKMPSSNDELNKLLTGILLLNPDISLYWSLRRKYLPLDLTYELQLTRLVLSLRPTCLEAFNHRKWSILQSGTEDELIYESEMEILRNITDKYRNNYHVWQYAKTLTNHFLNHHQNNQHLLYKQFIEMDKFIKKHISDYSAITFRQFLIKAIMKEGSFYPFARFAKDNLERYIYNEYEFDIQSMPPFIIAVGLLVYELHENHEMIEFYEGIEALWHHRRFIFYLFNWLIKMYNKKLPEWATSTFDNSIQHNQHYNDKYLDLNQINIDNLNYQENLVVQRVFQELPNYETRFLNNLKIKNTEQKRLKIQHVKWLENYIALKITLSNNYW